MTHTEIVNKVKSILNEHGEVDAVSIGEDRVLLEDYIESAIPDAVIMLAQKGYRVNKKKATADTWEDLEIADNDFISLIRADGQRWKQPVFRVTEDGSPEYIMAHNPYTAPGINNPVVIMVEGTPYGMPSDTSATLLYNAKYNPYKTNAETGKKELDENYELNAEPKEAAAVCYMTAALVLGMFGDDQGKQRLSDIATNMLQ